MPTNENTHESPDMRHSSTISKRVLRHVTLPTERELIPINFSTPNAPVQRSHHRDRFIVVFINYIEPLIDIYNMREDLTTLEMLSITRSILRDSGVICNSEDLVPDNFLVELVDKIEAIYTYILDNRYPELISDCDAHGNRLMEYHVECITTIYKTVFALFHYISRETKSDFILRIYKLSYYFIFRHCTLSGNSLPKVKQALQLAVPELVFSRKKLPVELYEKELGNVIEGTAHSIMFKTSFYKCTFCNAIEKHENASFTFVDTCSHLICRACIGRTT